MNRCWIFFALITCFSCSSGNAKGEEDPSPQPPVKAEYTYSKVDYRRWSVGKFYPWTNQLSSETRTIDGMNWFTPVDGYVHTKWGGRCDIENPQPIVGTEGFFRLAKVGERWYFLDPDGGCVLIHGTQHVRPQEDVDVNTQFSSVQDWSVKTGELLAKYDFNYLSYGWKRIEPFPSEMRDGLLEPQGRKMAYGETLYLLRTFMWDMYHNYGYSFDDKKYHRLVLVFDPLFKSYVKNLAQEKCAPFVNDKHFVGYYLDNELHFAAYKSGDELRGIELRHFLHLPDRYRGAREFADAFMEKHHISSETAITDAHREAFRREVAEQYFQITTEAVRAADPNHLILGVRLHDKSKLTEDVVRTCAKYCDVVSINHYGLWQPDAEMLSNWKIWTGGKPIFISEFYVKASNAQFGGKTFENTLGGGWMVRTQRDRGLFYQNFCLRLLESQFCVGWTHFEYADSWGENHGGVNKGIVTMDYKPYTEFLSLQQQLHQNIYALADYYDKHR